MVGCSSEPDRAVSPLAASRAAPPAILACLLWSSAFVGVKVGLAYVPPLTFAGWRFMLAGLLLVPLAGGPGSVLRTLAGHWRVIAAVSLFQTVILYGSFFLAMKLVSGAQAAIIVGSNPLIVALLSHLLMKDDRMTSGKGGVIALGICGVAIIALASKPWRPTGLRELGGMGLLIVAICSSGLGNIVVARHRRQISPVALNSCQMGLGGLLLFLIALAAEGAPASVPPAKFLLVMLYLAMVSATGFSIWFYLLKRVKVSRLNMWKFLIPLSGVVLSWILLAESPDVATVAGMICVSVAVFLSHRQAVAEAAPAGI